MIHIMNENSEELKLLPKIKCPKCKSRKLAIIEIIVCSTTHHVNENGVFEISFDNNDAGPTGKLEIVCKICSHTWNRCSILDMLIEHAQTATRRGG